MPPARAFGQLPGPESASFSGPPPNVPLDAVIFDLDGVITDTSELHYLAWQRLADEEGYPFDRAANEALRGLARRASLEALLAGRPVPAPPLSNEQMEALMERKNRYYVESLATLTPESVLPGVPALLAELRAAGVRIALGSASRNAPTVLQNLGIAAAFDAVADGSVGGEPKPAPDLFLKAAAMLEVSPAACAVVEDASVGVDAALAGGMWAVGIGPLERVGHAHVVFPDLAHVTLADLRLSLANAAWAIHHAGFDPAELNHRETVFTTGNGYVNVRGALEERLPNERPASFIHGLWDDVPLFFSELANIPRWYGVEIWIDGVPFRADGDSVLGQRRTLDMRTGVLARDVRWQQTPGEGPVVELHFERFCSRAQPNVAVVRARAVVVEGGPATVRIRVGLDKHVENVGLVHWALDDQDAGEEHASLLVHTRGTGTVLGMALAVAAESAAAPARGVTDAVGQPGVERSARLERGEQLAVEGYVGMVTSLETADPLPDAVQKAAAARAAGYAALRAESDALWHALWQSADVRIEGDLRAQQAQRFNTFQLLVAAPAHTERASIGAKTLSGFGYRHHVFWDTEIFILPLFIYTQPALARNMLMYRWHNLPGARAKAAGNGFEGAQFPWESAGDGRETTPPWLPHWNDPAQLVRIWTGDIEIHITADIAYAALQYWRATGDDAWMRDHGAELVIDGAKFWASAARLEEDGLYHYRDVIGPDEYHDHVDDNAYTNTLARWHIDQAFQVLEWLRRADGARHEALVQALDLTPARLEQWRAVADQMHLGSVTPEGVIEQFAGYFGLEEPDFALLRDPLRRHSMQAILGIEGVAQTQILKQPDVLMLQYLLPTAFAPEQMHANHAYYDPRTDHEHGSSLGPSISAAMACRTGDAEAAYAHFMRAARADLEDVRHNAGDGIHAASAGGTWQALVFGFGGLTFTGSGVEVQPRLPHHWTRLCFRLRLRGTLHEVDIRPEGVTLRTLDGA